MGSSRHEVKTIPAFSECADQLCEFWSLGHLEDSAFRCRHETTAVIGGHRVCRVHRAEYERTGKVRTRAEAVRIRRDVWGRKS